MKGGHVILLNPEGSEYYEETKRQALEALRALSGRACRSAEELRRTMRPEYLEAGASHVIVTILCLPGWQVSVKENLEKLDGSSGKGEDLVLDLSCRKEDG